MTEKSDSGERQRILKGLGIAYLFIWGNVASVIIAAGPRVALLSLIAGIPGLALWCCGAKAEIKGALRRFWGLDLEHNQSEPKL